ncbi:hypothetical protein LOK49_Contig180G00010 [Camellia lanceoleosa]|nr:hypothetical protein LOK49_Contig180G00010 [Camellia lanceoleosa]
MMSAFLTSTPTTKVSPNFEKSSEEEDHLIRSTKKIKSANLVEDQPMEPKMVMETEELGENSRMQDPSPPQPSLPKSFKAALTESKTMDYFFDDRVELFLSDEEDEQQEDQKGNSTTDVCHSVHMRFPKISLPKKLLEKIRKPWESSLIVKLLGKNIDYKILCTRVRNIWGLQGEFNAIELGNNYFLFKFSENDDYTNVYTGGPWVIMDHYLTMRRWEPNFKLSELSNQNPISGFGFELPIEYY